MPQQAVIKKFIFEGSKALKTMTWKPDGSHFVAVYDKLLVFWDTKEGWLKKEVAKKPITYRKTHQEHSEKSCCDIQAIAWSKRGAGVDTSLAVYGGTAHQGLSIINFSGSHYGIAKD